MLTCSICNLREINKNCQVDILQNGIVKGSGCLCKPCYDEFSKTGKFTEFHKK